MTGNLETNKHFPSWTRLTCSICYINITMASIILDSSSSYYIILAPTIRSWSCWVVVSFSPHLLPSKQLCLCVSQRGVRRRGGGGGRGGKGDQTPGRGLNPRYNSTAIIPAILPSHHARRRVEDINPIKQKLIHSERNYWEQQRTEITLLIIISYSHSYTERARIYLSGTSIRDCGDLFFSASPQPVSLSFEGIKFFYQNWCVVWLG